MTDYPQPLHGRCMCGTVRFSVDATLIGALYCHCQRCRRRSGTSHSMTALCAPGSFSVTEGEKRLRAWDPGDGWIKSFCSACGSHTHTTNPDDPNLVAVRMGCLEGDPGVRPSAHQFTTYAIPWEPIPDDGLPRFPERLGESKPEGD